MPSLETNLPWRALGTVLGLVLLAGSALAIFVMSGSAQPAIADDSQMQSGTANLGDALPSDKFIQTFQQQLSQQLQNAIDQSGKDQDARLQGVLQQQSALQEQLNTLQQSLETSPRAENPGTSPDAAPRVHTRSASGAESASPFASASASPFASGSASPFVSGSASPSALVPLSAVTDKNQADVAPNGFVEGTLLNGVVVIAGGAERESIVALRGPYHSANGFLSNLDGCFALVQGRPEIAAGRIDFKLSRLTCNFPDGASRTWDTAGWLVDTDGIRGVKATIVENLGRKAAVAAAGSAVAGVGQRLSQEQYQISTISTGTATPGTSSSFIGNAGMDALGGAANGAANSINQSINDYYNLFTPSLQVGGGTPVTVVLANDLRVPASGSSLTQTHVSAP